MRFTLVDIGSNSVKCNLYETDGQTLSLLLTRSKTLGLIRYIKDASMSREGISLLLETIREYHALGSQLGCERTLCVATASLRGLENGDAICDAICKEGCAMRIISGREEAMLGFAALGASLSHLHEKGILVDLGGASTEITAFENGEVKQFVSLPFGCLKLYMRHVASVFPDKSERKAMKSEVDAALSKLPFLREYGTHLYLIGGSAKTAGKVLAARRGEEWGDGYAVSAEAFLHFAHTYRDPGKQKIRTLIGAAPDRLHTFVPGLAALQAIAKAAGAVEITFSFAGVREGLAMTVLKGEWKDHA